MEEGKKGRARALREAKGARLLRPIPRAEPTVQEGQALRESVRYTAPPTSEPAYEQGRVGTSPSRLSQTELALAGLLQRKGGLSVPEYLIRFPTSSDTSALPHVVSAPWHLTSAPAPSAQPVH